MKNDKTIRNLILCIAFLSIIASAIGIFSKGGPGVNEITSFRGETIKLHGIGLYKNDSVSVAAQGIAQDIVTLFVGVPLLLLALYFTGKGFLKARLLLTGTLGYFLYTYISYVFLWMYNPLFIVYVVLMSTSFFAFTLSILSIDMDRLSTSFDKKLPVKFLGGFQIFLAVALCMMWLGKIAPTIMNNRVPVGLEHYTTLVIQGLDLGFIVPIAFLSGVFLMKRRPIGYLLSSVVIMKGFTMGIAITAMIIGQYIAGVKMGLASVVIFLIFSLFVCFCMVILLKNIKEDQKIIQ
ncbi:hypothetical protein [Anaeromicropila herbilytica]|uniref:Uncharacterized protein n=1 Tax=Anaeromicropila herbilytica TaxID=2785025 RepID=A0A7R7EKP0_9FIRM|nr:hypothetical protein [Anaeromicropila herbilytica]BCN30523.1 hypothetical protein bsdtb5_18180 [Anaeromicropila herbilytica]